MSSFDDRSSSDVATARALVIVGGAGRVLTDVMESRTGLGLAGNAEAMTAALLWINGPMRPGEIAQALGFTTGGSTKIVARLEEAGIVTKQREGDDRRAVLVSFTTEGERRMSTLLSDVAPVVRDLLAQLADLQVAT